MFNKKRFKKKLDNILQSIIIKKYSKCFVCGKETSCGHHYIPKSRSLYLRWDLDNIIPLCVSCHFNHHNGDPHPHFIVIKKKGFDWHSNLKKKSIKVFKDTKYNLLLIEQKLKEKY